MRFIIDEDNSSEIATIGTHLGLDVTHVLARGRAGYADEEQLWQAALQHRCIVTSNARDFAPLSQAFADYGFPHAGVLIISPWAFARQNFSAIAHALVAYAQEHPDDMPAYMVDYLRPVRPGAH